MIRRTFAEKAARKATRAARSLALFGPKNAPAAEGAAPVRDSKTLMVLLDRAFSAVVIARDKNLYDACPFCSSRPIECAFHFFMRGKWTIRWDLRNAVGSCFECNGLYEADDDFVKYAQSWFVDRFGRPLWEDLERLGHRIAKFSLDEMESMLARLKAEAANG